MNLIRFRFIVSGLLLNHQFKVLFVACRKVRIRRGNRKLKNPNRELIFYLNSKACAAALRAGNHEAAKAITAAVAATNKKSVAIN